MKYEDKFLLAQRQMKNLSLPAKIQKKMLKELSHNQKYLDAQSELNYMLQSLTPSLKHEIYFYIFSRFLMNYVHKIGDLT